MPNSSPARLVEERRNTRRTIWCAGAIYHWGNRVKLAMLGTYDDANSANFRIPAYMVWDFTAEVKVYKEMISVIAGINNLFDEDYYSHVRSNGIDPAYGRNCYAGLSFAF